MDNLKIPEYVEPDIVETTFMATREDTYFIWIEERGKEEANKLWKRCMGDEPIPEHENKPIDHQIP